MKIVTMSFEGRGGGKRWSWRQMAEGTTPGEMSWMGEEASRALVPMAVHTVVAKVIILKASFIEMWVRLR